MSDLPEWDRNTLVFHSDINPVPWKAPTLGTRRAGGRVVPTSAPNAEMVAYQNALREAWEKQFEYAPIAQPVRLTWAFSRRLARYQGPSGRWVTKKPCDLSNLVKSSEDALQPWLLANDIHVVLFTAQMLSQSADTESGVVLTINPA